MIPKLWTPGMIYHVSLGPAKKFHFHSTYSFELPVHTILSPRSPFQGSLMQLQKHNSYNWLAGSPFWVSEVLDKHIHTQGGYQWRWTHDRNTSKVRPIFMVRFLSVDQDSNPTTRKRCTVFNYMAPTSFRQKLHHVNWSRAALYNLGIRYVEL